MKKLLTLSLSLFVIIALHAQHNNMKINNDLLNQSVKVKINSTIDDAPANLSNEFFNNPTRDQDWSEVNLGGTVYDNQTNNTMQNRIYMFEDGTVGGIWTRGMTQSAFPDRGTGYNYYNGTEWGPEPTARIETMRAGWPSYLPYGPNGEMVISHSANTTGLILNKRDQKGTGAWIESYLVGPIGHEKIEFPKAVASGANNEYTHTIYITAPENLSGSLYNGMNGCLLYSRSSNGGATWEVENAEIDGISNNYMNFVGGDAYSFAEPQANTLAFVVSSKWHDLLLFKSTDNGDTWDKTVIWEHPYPLFDWDVTITDTFYTVDATATCVLDKDGKAHVSFGIVRVGYFEIADTYTIFPFVDGVGYWNEDMPAFSNDLNTLSPYDHPDSEMIENYNLIGWAQDINGNGLWDIIGGTGTIGSYGIGASSFPELVADDDYNLYMTYSSVTETFQTATQNYRHLWIRVSNDNGVTWNDSIIDLTSDVSHFFSECVFPSASPTSNDALHMIYQMDTEPGIAVSGDEDPYGDNFIPYIHILKSELGVGIRENNEKKYVSQTSSIYPNPAKDISYIDIHVLNSAYVSMDVYNMLGQNVKSINKGNLTEGIHKVELDVNGLEKGIYLVTINANEEKTTRKLIVE